MTEAAAFNARLDEMDQLMKKLEENQRAVIWGLEALMSRLEEMAQEARKR